MNIDETLAYIHTTDWRGTKPGLTRIRALLDRLGNPERQLKFVHVTGTNGKGSTCAMLASILHEAGLRTGLYTSPYIVRFNERIQVDGEQIPDDALCALTEEVRAQADAMPDHPSEFELVTAIAMLWFLRSRCDIVVCEVGMGGEFDATNVIPAPEAAVFTNIGLDHMQYLGGTVEEISATKAGILKPGCDAVLYPSGAAAEDVIAARCRALGVPLHRVDFSSLRLTAASLQRQIFSFGERSMLRLPLLGGFQLRNAAVALTVVDVLRGADTENLRQWGLVNLPVYGTSEARRALLMEVVELLAADGYLAITEGKFPLVGFGPRYREAAEPDFALRIKQTPKVRKGSAAKPPKAARAGAADLAEVDAELFERLRALRLALAQEAAVPPYVIFHDATLAAMAAARPATEEELLALPGVGEKKLATYGKAFLEEIASVPEATEVE